MNRWSLLRRVCQLSALCIACSSCSADLLLRGDAANEDASRSEASAGQDAALNDLSAAGGDAFGADGAPSPDTSASDAARADGWDPADNDASGPHSDSGEPADGRSPGCADSDGDRHGVGGGCAGPDCNDGDAACWGGACCPGGGGGKCSSSSTDLFRNPFNKGSAFHRPIGTDAVYASDSDPATIDWKKANAITINAGAPWGTSLIETDASDPEKTVHPVSLKCDNISGIPVTLRFPSEGFVTKVVMNSSGCTDGVVVIYDRPSEKPHQIRQYNWNDGKPLGGQYKSWSIRGLGHGTKVGDRVGTSASGVAAMFGLMRGHEVNTPGFKIEHVHQITLPRKPGHCAIMLSRNIVWPASSTDGSANQPGHNTGHIPYGGLLALLPQDKGGPSLTGLSEPGRRVAEALRDYGAVAVDGGACVAMRGDQLIAPAIRTQIMADLKKIYPYMRLVKNTAPEQQASGGGAPRALNCAFDAPR